MQRGARFFQKNASHAVWRSFWAAGVPPRALPRRGLDVVLVWSWGAHTHTHAHAHAHAHRQAQTAKPQRSNLIQKIKQLPIDRPRRLLC